MELRSVYRFIGVWQQESRRVTVVFYGYDLRPRSIVPSSIFNFYSLNFANCKMATLTLNTGAEASGYPSVPHCRNGARRFSCCRDREAWRTPESTPRRHGTDHHHTTPSHTPHTTPPTTTHPPTRNPHASASCPASLSRILHDA